MSALEQAGLRPLIAEYSPLIEYATAWDLQKQVVSQLDKEERADTLLLLQHPPTYTMGTDKHPEHLLLPPDELKRKGISLFQIDRGGDITYHGPGQLVGYPILFLPSEGLDLHGYLRKLEQVIIDFLADYHIEAGRKAEYTGVWVGERKIAAIGVKFNRSRHRKGFITSHGFALNLHQRVAVEGFGGIIPCGIEEYGIVSLEELTGEQITLEQAARLLLPHFSRRFGYAPTVLL